jgi:uroporphyrinogen-III decarboxylase
MSPMDPRERLEAAIALQPVDRVPVVPKCELFAARFVGATLGQVVRDLDVARDVVVQAFDELGGWDAVSLGAVPIVNFGSALFGVAEKLPGYQLGEDELWQVNEKEVMSVEDYDLVREEGWFAYITEVYPSLGYPVPPEELPQRLAELAAQQGKNIRVWRGKGVPVFSGLGFTPAVDMIALTRSLKSMVLDMYRMPDKVLAAVEAIETEQVPRAISDFKKLQAATPGDPMTMMIGGLRPSLLAPRLFEKFFWPFFKRSVEQVVDAGITPILHFDGNWDAYLRCLLELPSKKIVLELDGATDIFRAKAILRGHMCICGDVPPALLVLRSSAEVAAYCRRLIDVVGEEGGFILSSGCAVPVNALAENVRALIETGTTYYPYA